ncbi:MAG: carbohydrate kinase family protein [Deltaproteobacteria bacterium]|jgi:sulfofructose kinase|nr:carbohydrate kinase family protein [Deltaproteobacteria bacterium]
MNRENLDVLVIGRSCLDFISVVNRFPEENRKAPLEFRLTEGGGQGGTASCCISRLGGKVAYLGKLGDDDEGRFCLKRLKEFGVPTDFIEIVSGGKTPVAYLFVTAASGHRTIIYERNSLPAITIDEQLKTLTAQTEIVLLDPEVTYLGEQLKAAAEDGIKIVYDCERWRRGIEDIMVAADYFIPSAEFLDSDRLNFGNISFRRKIALLKAKVSGQLVVTRGEKGAYYPVGDKLYQVAAPPVKAVDTIGAGDNFHAAFALALKKGFDLHRAVKLSVAVASLSCREFGGRNGIPPMEEALQVANKLKERVLEP